MQVATLVVMLAEAPRAPAYGIELRSAYGVSSNPEISRSMPR